MKKPLTFLLVFCLLFYPERRSTAQQDFSVSTGDINDIKQKDQSLKAKIDSQLVTANKLVDKIADTRPHKIVKYRTVVKNHVRIDSFYVFIDTCFQRSGQQQNIVPDTVWMEKNKPRLKEFLRGIFNNKKERKNELKVVQQ